MDQPPPAYTTSHHQPLSDEDRHHLQRELNLLTLQIAAQRATILSSTAIILHSEQTHDQLKQDHRTLDMQFEIEWREHNLEIDEAMSLNNTMPRPPCIGAPRGTSVRVSQPAGWDGRPTRGGTIPGERPLVDEFDELRLSLWNFDGRVIGLYIEAYVHLDRKIRPVEELLASERAKVAVGQHVMQKLEARKLVVEMALGVRN